MVSKIGDLVHQTTNNTGSGTLVLDPVNGKRTFNLQFSNGTDVDDFYYFISHRTQPEWEVGTGHMSDAVTLVRDTVLSSSNADALVVFSPGLKDVVNDLPASIQNDLEGDFIRLDGTSTTTAMIPFAQGTNVPDGEISGWGGTPAVPDLAIYSDATGTFVTAQLDNDITVRAGSVSVGNGKIVNLEGGTSDDFEGGLNGYVRVGTTGSYNGITVGGIATPGPAINDLFVSGNMKVNAYTQFAQGVAFKAGGSGVSAAPVFFSSGALMLTPLVGAYEFLTDKVYFTITTGTARKEFTMNDGTLTSGRVPFATTNGRLTDSSAFTFSGSTLTATNLSITAMTSNLDISKISPLINLTDSTGDDYRISTASSTFTIQNTTDSRSILSCTGAGVITLGSATSGTALTYAVASSQTHSFQINGIEYFGVKAGEIVCNDTGAATNFRVESDTDVNNIFSDATNDRVGIGTAAPTKKFGVNGDIALETAGNGIYIKEGSNATMGVATLVGGTVTVNTTKVTANSRIFLTIQSLGTVAAPKSIGVTARSASTSFTITSEDGTDTSVIAWQIIEPA